MNYYLFDRNYYKITSRQTARDHVPYYVVYSKDNDRFYDISAATGNRKIGAVTGTIWTAGILLSFLIPSLHMGGEINLNVLLIGFKVWFQPLKFCLIGSAVFIGLLLATLFEREITIENAIERSPVLEHREVLSRTFLVTEIRSVRNGLIGALILAALPCALNILAVRDGVLSYSFGFLFGFIGAASAIGIMGGGGALQLSALKWLKTHLRSYGQTPETRPDIYDI